LNASNTSPCAPLDATIWRSDSLRGRFKQGMFRYNSGRQENLRPNNSNRAAHHKPAKRGDRPAAELALSNVGFRQSPGPELA
jgi:hypothetical protein